VDKHTFCVRPLNLASYAKTNTIQAKGSKGAKGAF